MFEAIISAVGAILANIFPIIIQDRKALCHRPDIEIAKLKRDLGNELQKFGTGYNELHVNQAMQLFFETLRNLDVQIRIRPPRNDHLILNIQNHQTMPEFEPMLKITAQDVLDFETTKTIFEMIGADPREEKCSAAVCAPEAKSVLQIMQKSKNRYEQRLAESHLSGGKP